MVDESIGRTPQTANIPKSAPRTCAENKEHTSTCLLEIPDECWDLLFKNLTFFGIRLLQQYTWRGIYGGETPGGKTGEDLVQNALEKGLQVYLNESNTDQDIAISHQKFIAAVRQYSKDRDTDTLQKKLYWYFRGFIRSEISNTVRWQENIKTIRNNYDTCTIYDISKQRNDPEHQVIMSALKQPFIQFLNDNDSHDPYLADVATRMLAGKTGSQEIADDMHLTVNKVNNCKKKIKRQIKAFRDQEKEY